MEACKSDIAISGLTKAIVSSLGHTLSKRLKSNTEILTKLNESSSKETSDN
jgi:leucyl aminopeptidase